MRQYVLGFAFDPPYKNVVLIRKNRPAFQAGKLNGVGGKLEVDEAPVDAMVREFYEETGLRTKQSSWHMFAKFWSDQERGFEDPTFEVRCFYRRGSVLKVVSTTDERVGIYDVDALEPPVMANLRWLIPMAISVARGENGCTYFEIKE